MSSAYAMEFPVFTYESAWKRLSSLIDLDPLLSVCRDADGECIHLTGKLGAEGRSFYFIYKFGENEFGIEQAFTNLEASGSTPLAP